MRWMHSNSRPSCSNTVSAIIRSEPVISIVRREIRRLFPDIKVGNENLAVLIENEVVKRDTMEGDKAKEASARIRKATNKLAKAKASKVMAEAAE